MEHNKTFFDYIAKIFFVFGFTVMIFIVLTVVFGNVAKENSTLFALGNTGLAISSLVELFLLSSCIVFFRFLFLTDTLIKSLSVTLRTVALVSSIFVLVILFIVIFHWFPVDLPIAWFSFALCFFVCFVLSLVITSYKDHLENKKMQDALDKMKDER